MAHERLVTEGHVEVSLEATVKDGASQGLMYPYAILLAPERASDFRSDHNRKGRRHIEREGFKMIKSNDDQRVRLGLVEHAPELAHGGDGRVELRRIFTGLTEKKCRRVTGDPRRDNLSHKTSTVNARESPVNGDRTVVVSDASLSFRKEFCLLHPAMRLLEHLARIRLEHQALSRPEPADVDHPLVLLG